jgi:hypothetical protein
MQEVIWWGDDGCEVLTHADPDEAIEAHIDGWHPDPIESIGEITMYEYAPMKPTLSKCGSPLERVLEQLDEEYGDPNGDGYEVTEAMKEAEQVFLKAVLAQYRPWACEQTGKKITVNALEWVQEHRPDWLQKSPS